METKLARTGRSVRAWFQYLTWPVAMAAVLLLALIWGLVAWESARIRHDYVSNFHSELRHQGEVVDDMLQRQLDSIDNALLILRSEYLTHRDDLPRMIDLLRSDPLRGLDVRVTIIDQDGYSRYSDTGMGKGNAVGKPLFLGDREHFQYFASGGPDKLFIGRPTMGRVTKQWGMPLSRPILGSKGQFLGVIAVFLPPHQLVHLSHALDSHNDGHITLLTSNGIVLATSVDPGSSVGTSLTPQHLAILRQQQTGINVLPATPADAGRTRLHRWSNAYPLLILLSHSDGPMLSEIAMARKQVYLFGGVSTLIGLVGLMFFHHSQIQRRRIERQMMREHAHLAEAQRIAKLGSWEFDHRSDQLYWSDEVYRIFELDRLKAPTTYEGFLVAIHPEDREAVNRAFRQSLQDYAPYGSVHRILMPDGRVKWVQEEGHTDFTQEGHPIRSSGTVHDITERKRFDAERDALHRERLLLLNSTGEGIFGIDNTGRCTFINPSACLMLGYAEDEVIGQNIHKLVHYKRADGTPYPEDECAVYQTFKTGIAASVEHDIFWRKDKSALHVAYSAYPIRDEHQIFGTVTVFSDITERLQTESEMRIAATAFESQEGMFVTDAKGTILRVNRAFTEITGYPAGEAVGKNPRFRSSGRHDAAFYQAMWDRIQAVGFWKGDVWNRRKNGEVYPESVTITAVRGVEDRITHFVATVHDISERVAAAEKIRSMAFFDPLTQLPNRRLLHDRLQQAMRTTVRNGHHGALLFIDLDKFKQLNDTHGHDAGDLLLQQVAQRLTSCVRQSDTVARLGGDEFVVLLEELSQDMNEARLESEAVGHKILQALNQPYDLDGLMQHSTPSIGATLFAGLASDSTELLRQADRAMYRSKAAGRNTMTFYEPSLPDDTASVYGKISADE